MGGPEGGAVRVSMRLRRICSSRNAAEGTITHYWNSEDGGWKKRSSPPTGTRGPREDPLLILSVGSITGIKPPWEGWGRIGRGAANITQTGVSMG